MQNLKKLNLGRVCGKCDCTDIVSDVIIPDILSIYVYVMTTRWHHMLSNHNHDLDGYKKNKF